MQTQFPDLPTILNPVTITHVTLNVPVQIEVDAVTKVLENTQMILEIPSWRTSRIYKFISTQLPDQNTLYLHINEDDSSDGYFVFKDDEVYEMVYYKVQRDVLEFFVNHVNEY